MNKKKSSLFGNKLFLAVETIFLIGIPLVLVLIIPQLLPFRLLVMAAGVTYIYHVMKICNISIRDMGILKRNAIASIKHSFLPTILASFVLVTLNIIFPILGDYREIVLESYGFPVWIVIPFYILISVPLQEFVLRGFYIPRLELISKNPIFLILYSSFIFAVIHAAFQNKFLVPLAFLFGIYLSYLFLRFRNLAGPIFAHAVVGSVFLWLVLS